MRGAIATMKYKSNREGYVNAALFIADFVLLNVLLRVFFLAAGSDMPAYFHSATKITVLVMNLSLFVAEYFFHSIIYRRVVGWRDILWRTSQLVVTQVFLSFVLLRLLSDTGMWFTFMLVFGSSYFLVIILSRVLERWTLKILRQRGGNAQNIIFVGNDLSLKRLYGSLTATHDTGYRILGYYADHDIAGCPKPLKRLGTMDDLNRLMDDDGEHSLLRGVDIIYCCLSHTQNSEITRIEQACDHTLTQFYYVPRAFEEYGSGLKPVRVGDYVFYTNHVQPLLRLTNRVVKRTFDVVVSLCVCVVLVPVAVIVGIIIKLQSPGPVFFGQQRTGIDGRTFRCWKFRSMHVNAQSDTAQATEDDPRKFPFGDFMRRANIDELPQFFNVLKGDMSIVGPRPHMLMHTDVYSKKINNYMARLFCKPGVTGWAQVQGFRGETKELWQMEARVNCDIWYIEHWSFWLDLDIICKTVQMMFKGDKNAY